MSRRGVAFANVSQDYNPIHLDESFANATMFGQKIAHGMLIASYISGVIGKDLPGLGTIYAEQKFFFKKPVYYNQYVTIVVTVEDILIVINRIELRTQCIDDKRNILVDGIAVVLPRRKE